MSINRKQFCLLTTTLLGSAILPGCGGGEPSSPSSLSGAGGRGVVNLTIRWPERSRLIPEASNSIKFVVTTTEVPGVTTVMERVVARPAGNVSQVTLDGLPEVTLKITATAYPEAGGTGVAQATGGTQVLLTAEQKTASTSFTMNSTIDHIDITPPDPKVVVDGNLTLIAEAKDTSEPGGSLVLIAPGKLTWSSSNEAVVSVDPKTGVVTGKQAGESADVTVKDAESGKTKTVTVTVDKIELTISPADPTVECSVAGVVGDYLANTPKVTFVATGGTEPYTWSIKPKYGGTTVVEGADLVNSYIAGVIHKRTGLYYPNNDMATGIVTVTDAKGNTGSTTVTVTSALLSGVSTPSNLQVEVEGGSVSRAGTNQARVSMPVGVHNMTFTNVSSKSFSLSLNFLTNGSVFFEDGNPLVTVISLPPGKSVTLAVRRVQH